MKKFLIGLAGVMFAIMSSMALAQAPAIDDSEIISILNTVNQGEIKAAKKVQPKASNPAVLKYAQLMIADHQNALKATRAAAKKAKITPVANMYSRNLTKENSMAMRKMRKLQGAALDQTYMDSQIMMHQNVLGMIDTTLLPSSKNPEVKALVTNLRPVIEGHLQQAKQIRSAL